MRAEPAAKAPRWALWAPLGLFTGFVALVVIGLVRPASTLVPSRMIGQPLPAFTLPAAVPDRPGLASVDLADGHPHLLNIFASWCVPCVAEVPALADLKSQGVLIDGIAIRDHQADLSAFLAQHGNPYARIGSDVVSAVQLDVGSAGVPETFVVDGHGVIRYQHIGVIAPEDEAMLRAKLQEAGA